MTPFRIEHEFRAPSLALYWQVYSDDEHVSLLDEHTGVVARKVIEGREDDETRFRRLHIERRREVPAVLRRFVGEDVAYEQTETFFKRENRVEIEMLPNVFPGRTKITATYSVQPVGPGRFVRTVEGTISIKVPLAGSRAEKAILADMIRSYDVGTELTQRRLDAEAKKQPS